MPTVPPPNATATPASESPPEHCIIRLLSLPTLDRLATAHDPEPSSDRELVVVELIDRDGRSGFGECAALNRVGYTHEWARGAFAQLVAGRTGPPPDAPMARAALEMAATDLVLVRQERPLVDELAHRSPSGAAAASTVRAGFVLPLADPAATLAAAHRFAEAGIDRLKLKIVPGRAIEVVSRLRDELPSVEVHLDGNGSFAIDDLDELLALDALGVTAIEQPFAVDDLAAAIELTAAVSGFVVADEAATDLAAVERLVEIGACSAVSIKPPRLGGLAATLVLHRWCLDNGLAATAGGMLESGLGRHALAAVSALPGFTLTGDLSPARRWLAADPWPDLTLVGGRITVPRQPGVAPPPDRDLLEQHTIDIARLALR